MFRSKKKEEYTRRKLIYAAYIHDYVWVDVGYPPISEDVWI